VLSLVLLAAAALASLLALKTGQLGWKLAVPTACALALLTARPRPGPDRAAIWPVVVAFGFALVGDAFLSTRAGRVGWFVAGIAAYFVSHVGYVTYALPRGRLNRPTLGLALAAFLSYALLRLGRHVPDPVLLGAVIAYGLVSCLSLAAAVGLRQPALPKTLFIAGIGLLIFSDTLISFNEFLRYRAWNGWILPTYYLALLAVTGAVLGRGEGLGIRDQGSSGSSVVTESPPGPRGRSAGLQ
jgi:hypothetical protein